MVCALTPCFLATSGTGRSSASRRIVTICSSVNRVFFMAPSLADRADEPFGVRVRIGCAIWGPDDANPRVLEARPHRPTPLGIPVAKQDATPIGVNAREVPHDLTHERL